ncbi:transmembrane emp24 domain-containing protein p24beta3 [Tanacetum coccineum]
MLRGLSVKWDTMLSSKLAVLLNRHQAAVRESYNSEIKSSLSLVSAWRVSISTSMSSSRAVTSSGLSSCVLDAGYRSEKLMESGRMAMMVIYFSFGDGPRLPERLASQVFLGWSVPWRHPVLEGVVRSVGFKHCWTKVETKEVWLCFAAPMVAIAALACYKALYFDSGAVPRVSLGYEREMTLEEYEKELEEKRKTLVTGVSKEKCNDRVPIRTKRKRLLRRKKNEKKMGKDEFMSTVMRHGRKSIKSVSKRPQRNDIYIQVAEIEGHVATNLYDIKLTSLVAANFLCVSAGTSAIQYSMCLGRQVDSSVYGLDGLKLKTMDSKKANNRHMTLLQDNELVSSPGGNVVQTLKGTSGEKFEFKAPRSGMYQFYFHNSYSTPETVSFNIHVGHIPNEHDLAKDEHLDLVNVKIAELREALESVTAEQKYLKARDS